MMESKHRDTIYHQRCMEISREARDMASLTAAASQALNHPDVASDTVLTAMIRAFIAECEARLRIEDAGPREPTHAESQLLRPFATPSAAAPATKDQVVGALSRLRLRLEEHLAHYNESGASEVMVGLWDLYERYPRWIDRSIIERCQAQVRRLASCRDEFRAHLDDLVSQARQAAQDGEEKTASWLARRLAAIHTLLPEVLPTARLEQVTQEIRRSCTRHDQREAIGELMARERAVADEIKRIGAMVHRSQKLGSQAESDPALALEARTELQRAIAELRTHNNEWLADLMLELDTLMDDLTDSDGRIHAQIDRFLKNVRGALIQLHEQVKAIQKERAAARSASDPPMNPSGPGSEPRA